MSEDKIVDLQSSTRKYQESKKIREKMFEADMDFINFCTSQSLRHKVMEFNIMKKSPYFVKTEETDDRQKLLVEGIENLIKEEPLYFVVFADNLKIYDEECYLRCRDFALDTYGGQKADDEFGEKMSTLFYSELNEKQTACFNTLFSKDNPGREDFIKDMQTFAPERLRWLKCDEGENS